MVYVSEGVLQSEVALSYNKSFQVKHVIPLFPGLSFAVNSPQCLLPAAKSFNRHVVSASTHRLLPFPVKHSNVEVLPAGAVCVEMRVLRALRILLRVLAIPTMSSGGPPGSRFNSVTARSAALRHQPAKLSLAAVVISALSC